MKYYFLRFLGKIYQITGIYLGKYWENQYINKNYKDLKRSWEKYNKYTKTDRMPLDCYIGISRGMWQADHGFYRKWKYENTKEKTKKLKKK